MVSNRNRKFAIIGVALLGIVINGFYGINLLNLFFELQFSSETREILISAIALEFGWTALLIWLILKPFERRHLLLFTAVPMVIGNLLHSVNQSINNAESASAIILNLIVALLIAGVFVFAFFFGKPINLE